ncbi:MAG: MarR family winged helix-turn-helix transcriptional regulator [Sporolactobacillus sp.]
MPFDSQFKHDADASAGLLFIRAYNQWHTRIKKALRQLGLTHPQFVVLTTLHYLSQHDDNVSQVKLAKMAEMDVMSVSQIVRGIEARGLIKRVSSATDSRANALILLPRGLALSAKAVPVVEQIDADFFGALGTAEAPFCRALKALCAPAPRGND